MEDSEWEGIVNISRNRARETRPCQETTLLASAVVDLEARLLKLEGKTMSPVAAAAHTPDPELARTVDAQTTLIAGLHDRIVALEGRPVPGPTEAMVKAGVTLGPAAAGEVTPAAPGTG